MKYKIYSSNNYFFLQNTDTFEKFQSPKKNVEIDPNNKGKETYKILNLKDWDSTISVNLSELVDENNVPYTLTTWEDFYTLETGNFNSASGGSGAGITPTQEANLNANTSARHTHSNKAVLDLITAPFTTAKETKLNNIQDTWKGTFVNQTALTTAYPMGQEGWAAWNEATSTVWSYKSGAWVNTNATSIGDMLKSVYDPQSIAGDVFNMGNMVEDTDAKILTAEERDLISYFGGNCANATEMNAVGGLKVGKYVVRQDTSSFWQYNGTAWVNTLVNPSASVGAVTTILDDNLTPSKVVLSNTLGKIAVGDVTSSELLVLRTSNTATGSTILDTNRVVINDGTNIRQNSFTKVWDWIVDKATGAVSTILTADLTANRALISNATGKVAVSTITTAQLQAITTLGTVVESAINTTITSGTGTNLTSITLTPGKWLLTGGASLNQGNSENLSDYVALTISSTATAWAQGTIMQNRGVMARMVSGEDAGIACIPLSVTVTSNTIYYLKAYSDFTTETNSLQAILTATKVGI